MRFARLYFLEENISFLRATSSTEIDRHVIPTHTEKELKKEKDEENGNYIVSTYVADNHDLGSRPSDVEKKATRHSTFSFEAILLTGKGQWCQHIIDKYIQSNSPMEINLSSKLRKAVLNTLLPEKAATKEENIEENTEEDDGIEDYKRERERIMEVLKPARKQVMNMLTKGEKNILQEFKETPMYQVCLDWRHRKQKGIQSKN
jgi:hypothetical protein